MTKKPTTSSEERLYNRNLSQSAEDISPNMSKVNRVKDSAANIARAKNAETSNRNRSRYVTEGANISNTRVADYADVAPKKKAKPAKPAEYKMPKSTTPDMDTTQGTTGSRNSFDEGEVAPKAVIAIEADKQAPAPVEERYVPRAKEETSRFSASNPMGMKRGGTVGSSKASSRGDGCAQRGKTKGRLV